MNSIFRCTLTKIPESNALLQKSRLPLGILIHPFRDLNVSDTHRSRSTKFMHFNDACIGIFNTEAEFEHKSTVVFAIAYEWCRCSNNRLMILNNRQNAYILNTFILQIELSS